VIVSFHPRIRADVNFQLTSRDPLHEGHRCAIARAKAVIVTQHVGAQQYAACKALCRNVFPDYTYRFGFEGKYGNTRLFARFDAPHPHSVCYSSVEEFKTRHFKDNTALMPFPFVLKGDLGGGGWAVFLVRNQQELDNALSTLGDYRLHPTRRFIVQAFVPHGGQDLRVVVIGDTEKAYWRCQPDPKEFRNNVGRGARIRHQGDRDLMAKGIACVRRFCKKTGINLAAFDVLFDRSVLRPEPLLSEINFLFGRKGLGGSGGFHALLKTAVDRWLRGVAGCGDPPCWPRPKK